MTDTTRLNLLDRLLEVAKDFEAERFQDEVEHKKQLRAQQQYVEDVQQKLFEAESEIDGLKAEINQLKLEQSKMSKNEDKTNLIREIVALRFIVADLNAAAQQQAATTITADKTPTTLSTATKNILKTLCNSREFCKAACLGNKEKLLKALQPDSSFQNVFFDIVNTALVKSCTTSSSALLNNNNNKVDNENINTNTITNNNTMNTVEDASTKKILEQGSKMEILDVLLGAGATMAARDERGTNETILHGAAGSGSIAVVETILAQEGVDINAVDINNRTALHSAAESSNSVHTMPVIKALLMAGCDPTIKNKDNETAQEIIEKKYNTNVTNTNNNKNSKEKGDNKKDDDDIEEEEEHENLKLIGQRLKNALNIFSDPTVLFWNCSVRAFDAYSSENFKIALDVYAMAIKLVQENSLPVSKEDQSRLYYNRARASTHLNCRVKAMKDLESALDLAPNYTNARALLSQCQFDLYQYDRCVQGLKLVLDKDPNNNKWNKLIVEARRLRDANHYEVLGIERNADEKEIKKAYRNASKKWHPDKHQKNEDNKARANTMFKRVNEANQVLGDSYKKLLYDVELNKKLESELNAMEQMRQREEEYAAARRASYNNIKVPRRPSTYGNDYDIRNEYNKNRQQQQQHMNKNNQNRTSMGGARDMFNEVFSRRHDVDVDDEVINQWQRVSVDTAGTYGSALDSDYYEEQTDDEEEEEELFGY